MMDKALEEEVKLAKNPSFVLYKGRKSKPPLVAQALRALVMALRVGESEASALKSVGQQFYKYEVGRNFVRGSDLMYKRGLTFKAALISSEVLPPTAVELIEASPTSQTLQANLEQAARLVTEGHNVRKMLITNLAQPGFMMVLILAFLYTSTGYLIPKFLDAFSALGTETPPATIIMQKAAVIVTWVLSSVIVVCGLLSAYWFAFGRRHRKSKMFKARMMLRIPVIGPILQISTTARLFRLLSANLDTGVRESDALRSAGRGCGNYFVEQHCAAHAEKMLQDGVVLKDYIRHKAFPFIATAMITSAPSVLQEIAAMNQLAPEYEMEATLQLGMLSETLTPILNYIVYGIAGALILALMVPMYSVYEPMMNMAT